MEFFSALGKNVLDRNWRKAFQKKKKISDLAEFQFQFITLYFVLPKGWLESESLVEDDLDLGNRVTTGPSPSFLDGYMYVYSSVDK